MTRHQSCNVREIIFSWTSGDEKAFRSIIHSFSSHSRNIFRPSRRRTFNRSAESQQRRWTRVAYFKSSPRTRSLPRWVGRRRRSCGSLSNRSSRRDASSWNGVSGWIVYTLYESLMNAIRLFRPSTRFVAPMMVVERHKRDLRERHKKSHNQTQCHYQGKIRGHEHSKVALSACDGLVRTNLNVKLICLLWLDYH